MSGFIEGVLKLADCDVVEKPAQIEQGRTLHYEARVRIIQEELYRRQLEDGTLPRKNGAPITHDDYVDGMLGNDTNRALERYFGNPNDRQSLENMPPAVRAEVEFIQREHGGLFKVHPGEQQLVCPVEPVAPKSSDNGFRFYEHPGMNRDVAPDRFTPDVGAQPFSFWQNPFDFFNRGGSSGGSLSDALSQPQRIPEYGPDAKSCPVQDFNSEGGSILRMPFRLFERFGEAHDNQGPPLDWRPAPMPMLPSSPDVTNDRMLAPPVQTDRGWNFL